MNRLHFVFALLLVAPGCSLVVDGALAGRDAGSPMDTPTAGCGVAVDGTECAVEGLLDNRICIAGNCVPASCGDGFVEARDAQEQCDDANGASGDGCDADCTFSCEAATDCDDGESCNGAETCDTTAHVCEAGMPEMDGVSCLVEGMPAMCQGGICRAGVCPDGTVDAGEECDDDNDVDGDGCDADCTFTCEMDEDCQDADACNGAEVCDTALHTCSAGTALACDDMDDCTTDSCAAATGCVFTSVFVDGDMDGYSVAMAGAPASCVGTDCDDTNAAAYPGAPEACGAGVDLNCDGSTAPPTWYADCDGDTYAPAGATSEAGCSAPTSRPDTCSSTSWRWVSRAPVGTSSTDCADGDAAANPAQRSYFGVPVIGRGGYDFNCDGRSTTEYPAGRPRDFVECSGLGRLCSGTTYWTSTSVTCGPHSGILPTLSHCESVLTCSRTTDATATVRCH